MANPVDLAWAAGLFEGEGSCFVNARDRIAVALTMTDRDVVERFSEIVGCGAVRHYEKEAPRKPVWAWSANGRDDVISVLESFLPFLGERRLLSALIVLARARDIQTLRGPRARCRKGHSLLEPDNVYTHLKTGKRQCRICNRERNRKPCRVR